LSCTVAEATLSGNSTTAGASFAWSNGATTASTVVTVGGIYTVVVTNPANGCTASSTANVTVSIPIPTGIYTYSTTSNSTTIGWTAVAVATSYSLDYRRLGTTTWTTINGITTNYKTITGLNPATTYQFRVRSVCGANQTASVNSATGTVTTTSATSYCASAGSSTTDNAYIQTVALGSYSNISGNNNGYGNFLTTVWTVSKQTQYGVSITPGYFRTSGMVCYRIWIDYNHDNDFGDAGETIFAKSISSRSPALGDFVIPNTALLGNTRMRVSFKTEACPTECATDITAGEVEDYTLNIIAAPTAREINPVSAAPTIQIYPNPTTHQLTIDAATVAELSSIQVFDMTGKLITTYDHLQDWKAVIEVSEWSAGVYLVKVNTTDGNQFHQKVIKQ
jgi:hypothetical protein